MKYILKKIVLAALFAAFACVATMSIRIPTPGTGGYIHPGDAVVILSGIILGPHWGLLAAGIGSALADLLGGYFIYVPITFVIKGAVAFAAGLIYQKIGKTAKSRGAAVVLGALAAEGESVVAGLDHIDRGYDDLEGNLRRLGADIKRDG